MAKAGSHCTKRRFRPRSTNFNTRRDKCWHAPIRSRSAWTFLYLSVAGLNRKVMRAFSTCHRGNWHSKRATLAVRLMHGNRGTSFEEVRPRFVEMSKLSNDGQELNDSGTTHALRSETASLCSRQNWSRFGDGITDQSFDCRVARKASAGEQQTLGARCKQELLRRK